MVVILTTNENCSLVQALCSQQGKTHGPVLEHGAQYRSDMGCEFPLLSMDLILTYTSLRVRSDLGTFGPLPNIRQQPRCPLKLNKDLSPLQTWSEHNERDGNFKLKWPNPEISLYKSLYHSNNSTDQNAAPLLNNFIKIWPWYIFLSVWNLEPPPLSLKLIWNREDFFPS